jgi:hypothetical protein
MATKRKTGKDYRDDLQNLKLIEKGLKAKVALRLFELSTQYPDVPLTDTLSDTYIIKSGKIANKGYIAGIELEAQIKCVEIIEKWIADHHQHKQLDIEYKPQINID